MSEGFFLGDKSNMHTRRAASVYTPISQSRNAIGRLKNEKVYILGDRHSFKESSVHGCGEDALLLLKGEATREIPFELLDEQRNAFLPATLVTDGIFDCLFEDSPVFQFHGEGIGDGTLFRIVIVVSELRLFYASDAIAQLVDLPAPVGIGCI